MNKPRAYTEEEIRAKFISHIQSLVKYWHSESRTPDTLGKLEGLAFSIMSAIDGSAVALPSFKLIASPHPEDKEYLISEGENYYPENVDISGCLHDQVFKKQG